MKKVLKIIRKFLLIFLLAAIFPGVVFAVTIQNNISSKSSSGGNNSQEEGAVEGNTKSEVSVKTIADGELVQDIYKVSENEDLRAEEEFNYENEGVRVKTNISVSAGGASSDSDLAAESFSEEHKVTTDNLASAEIIFLDSQIEGQETEIPIEKSEDKKFVSFISSFFKKIISYVFSIF